MARALLLTIGLALLASCGQPQADNRHTPPPALDSDAAAASASPSAQPPTITGTLTERQPKSILVEEQPGVAYGGRKIVFTVVDTTQILQRDGQRTQPATAAELAVGGTVEAWADGPIAESYPEQARASKIIVLAQPVSATSSASAMTTATADAGMLPTGQPDVSGVITSLDGGVLVEQRPNATIGDKTWLRLTALTAVFERTRQSLQPRDASVLQVGQQVEAWAAGAIAESYPAQGTAAMLVLAADGAASRDSNAPPDRASDLKGTITQLSNTIWLDGRTVLYVRPATLFFRQRGDTYVPIDAGELVEGQRVAVWIEALRVGGTPNADAVAVAVME